LKKKLLIDEFNQQNNVLEQSDSTLSPNVIEDSSTNYNEISRVKNILKIGTPLPLEPSLYSPIHHSGGNLEKTN
jgi:hypothetical protein